MLVRSCAGLVFKDRYDSIKDYSGKAGLRYFAVDRNEKAQIESILLNVSADMVITYRCPIIPTRYLTGLPHGAINLHSSLLPAFRGGDPLFWQVLNGVEETGVTVHRLSDQVDAGPILKQVVVQRPKNVSEAELANFLTIEQGLPALRDTVQAIIDDTLVPMVQPDEVDAPAAPNGARSRWRELANERGLGATEREDLACFLGKK